MSAVQYRSKATHDYQCSDSCDYEGRNHQDGHGPKNYCCRAFEVVVCLVALLFLVDLLNCEVLGVEALVLAVFKGYVGGHGFFGAFGVPLGGLL